MTGLLAIRAAFVFIDTDQAHATRLAQDWAEAGPFCLEWELYMREIKFALVPIIFFLTTAVAPLRAQVAMEVTQITCDQFLAFTVADPKDISIWMSGYFHAKHGLTTFEPQRFRDNYKALQDACFTKENLKRPVFEVAQTLLANQK